MSRGFGRILLSSAAACLVITSGLTRGAVAATPPEQLFNTVNNLHLQPEARQKARNILNRCILLRQQAYDAMIEHMRVTLSPEDFQTFKKAAELDANSPDQAVSTKPAALDGATRVPATLAGGYDTDPRDRGRPVVLIAAGLNVPDEVFRKAFSGVHPAPAGQQPQEADVRQNKRVLLDALAPYGVDDDRLNEVSNYYRYSRSRGQMWPTKPAKVEAVVRDGKITGFVIDDPGAGYSSAPTISVNGVANVKAAVKLKFGADLASNGSIKSVTLSKE